MVEKSPYSEPLRPDLEQGDIDAKILTRVDYEEGRPSYKDENDSCGRITQTTVERPKTPADVKITYAEVNGVVYNKYR